jgi:queuine tRNA-ribosyltransferase
VDLVKGRWQRSSEPILDGCPCPACSAGFSRAYLHYLLRAHELTGLRLVTLHNLSFIARLMADLREAIAAGRLEEAARALLEGAAPTSCTG